MANHQRPIPVLEPVKAAYLAALIDGEGSIECQKQMQPKGKTHRYEVRVSFTMVTTKTLSAVASWLNLNAPKRYESNDVKRSARYRLHIPKQMAVKVLKQCLPYLIDKREQAKLLIQIENIRRKHSPIGWMGQGMPVAWEKEVEPVFIKLRSLKSNKRPGNKRCKILQN